MSAFSCDFNMRDENGNLIAVSSQEDTILFRDISGEFSCEVEITDAYYKDGSLFVHGKPNWSTLKYADENTGN